VGGLIGDEKTSQVIGGLGNILSGNKSTGTNATNNASSPVGGLLQGLGGLLGDKTQNNSAPAGQRAATNAPATNAPAKNPLEGLFKSLQGPKKQ
jgi:hypothetical protein